MRRTRARAGYGTEVQRIRHLITIPPSCQRGLFKCRVSYGQTVGPVTLQPYRPRPIKQLKPIAVNLDYSIKAEDRSGINQAYSLRGEADDIIMVRNGLITDTSYHNIVIKTNTGLYTPNEPMLAGTMRTRLLDKGIIKTRDLYLADLVTCQEIYLINALNPLGKVAIEPSMILGV